jgi:hypothetical protein
MSLIKSEHSSEGKSLRQFVMFEHSVSTLSYTIRAPFPGTYRLDIYGKDITTDKLYNLLCTYGIKCNRNKELEIDEYPDCPHLGWGPNPYALESGVAPTPKVSIIQDVLILSNSCCEQIYNYDFCRRECQNTY